MMRKITLTILILGLATLGTGPTLFSADPPAKLDQPKAGKGIIWPDPQPVPPVPPSPTPGVPIQLDSTLFFILQSDVPLIVLASPSNLVTITSDTGPMKIRGRFVDQPSIVQTRTFTAKYLYGIDAGNTAGTCELIAWPVGSTDSSTVERRTVQVGISPGPTPGPPTPTPPGPVPGPPVASSDPLATVLQAAYDVDKKGAPYPGGIGITRDKLVDLFTSLPASIDKCDTTGKLLSVVAIAANELNGSMKQTRAVIMGELLAKTGSKWTPITAEDKAAARVQFARMVTLLKGLK